MWITGNRKEKGLKGLRMRAQKRKQCTKFLAGQCSVSVRLWRSQWEIFRAL